MNKSSPLNKERIIEKCEQMNVEYVKHEKKEFNGKIKWVVTYKCNIHDELETSWESMKTGLDGCKECSKELRWAKNVKCDFCNKTSKDEKIITTERFGKLQNFCKTHYYQMVRQGEIKRTRSWENEIIEYDDYLEIVLYDKNQNENGKTKVSKQHHDLIKKYKWHRKIHPDRYTDYVVTTGDNEETIRLHVLIAKVVFGEKPQGKTVDHINRDGLDNRNENLCYKDQTEQNFNQKTRIDNTSGIRGVSYYNKINKWIAQVKYKDIRLQKHFTNLEDAINKRKYWDYLIENKLFKELQEEKYL